MIQRLCAIALLAMRAALRSRVVLALAALLLLALLGLPAWIRSDGTAEGNFAVLTGHTLAACFTLLAATTLWAGCAAMAAERSGGTAVLTAAKPVRPAELWLGKWFGLLALSAALMLLTMAGLWLQLRARATLLPDAWQRCHRIVKAVLPQPEIAADALLAQMRAQGRLPQDVPETEVRASLVHEIRNRYDLIAPGKTQTWRFALPTGIAAGRESVRLRALFESQYALRRETAISVTISNTTTAAACAIASEAMAGEPLLLALPGEIVSPGATLLVTFAATQETSEPLFIHPARNLALLLPGASLAANLWRAALVLWSILALFAACGLTLGSCFSFPVASFAATAFVLLTLIGACVQDDRASAEDDTRIEQLGRQIIRVGTSASRPLFTAAPIARLSRREELPLAGAARPLATGAVGGPLLLLAFSAIVLQRRENGA